MGSVPCGSRRRFDHPEPIIDNAETADRPMRASHRTWTLSTEERTETTLVVQGVFQDDMPGEVLSISTRKGLLFLSQPIDNNDRRNRKTFLLFF